MKTAPIAGAVFSCDQFNKNSEMRQHLAFFIQFSSPAPRFNCADGAPQVCACGGSYFVTAELIEGGNRDEITDLCKKSREIIRRVRGER